MEWQHIPCALGDVDVTAKLERKLGRYGLCMWHCSKQGRSKLRAVYHQGFPGPVSVQQNYLPKQWRPSAHNV